MNKQLKVALVHDYLREYGGAERVLEELHTLFPEAPVYIAFVDQKSLGIHWKRFKDWDLRQSWAAKIPCIKKIYSPMRILADKFFSSFDLSQYDIVISSTNMYMAKAIKTVGNTKHYCYCHTPPRSLYGYTTMTDWKKNPVIKICGELINHYLRIVDAKTSKNPDVFIANSKEVQQRIKKFYKRDSVVIYPPIDVPKTLPEQNKKDFILWVGRIGVSKHTDLVIKACTRMNRKLIVAGTGKNIDVFKEMAGPSVEFLGSVSDEKLKQLYAEASLLIYPAEDEDFGMIPVEAMAYGTPVIVHHSGGFLETVVQGKTGYFIQDFFEDSLISAIQKADKTTWSKSFLHKHALLYSKQMFDKKILNLIEE